MLLLGPDVFSERSFQSGALARVLPELGGGLKLRCPGEGQGTGCGLQSQQGEWPHGPVPETARPRTPVNSPIVSWGHPCIIQPRSPLGDPLSSDWLQGSGPRPPAEGPPCPYLTTSPSPGVPSSRVASCGGSSPSKASCHERGSVPHRLSVKNSCRRGEAINRLLTPVPILSHPTLNAGHWLQPAGTYHSSESPLL